MSHSFVMVDQNCFIKVCKCENFYAVVLAAVAVACQRPDSEPVKKPSGPVWAEISWNSIADSCTFVLVDNFLDKKKGDILGFPGKCRQ